MKRIIKTGRSILLAILSCCAAAALMLSGCGAEKQEEQPAAQQEADTGAQESGAAGAQGAAGTQGADAAAHESEAAGAQGSPTSAQDGTLRVQILKVGKADAIVLFCSGSTMVIDCGEEDDGQEVADYLAGQGVQKIDVLIVTHFDKDHVGGADTVVKQIPVDRVLLPAYEGAGTEYEDFMLALQEAGITPEMVTRTQALKLGAASAVVEPPASYQIPDNGKEYDNDFSLITTVEFGSKRLVFAGDIEKKRIKEWLKGGTVQPCDLLKVPHHGVYNKALADLFDALQPSFAIICDSQKNPADDRTLQLLEERGAECLRTANGDISILSDGQNIEVSQE